MPFEGPPQPNTNEVRKRPTVLAYHHEIADHFPEREEFEKHALNVAFAGPLTNDDSASDAVWGYTPEHLKKYMRFNQASVVISSVSSDNKFSKGYNGCTGIVALGIDKETGSPISFLSHADPHSLLDRSGEAPEEKEIIRTKLAQRVQEMVSRSNPSDLSFEIVGGGFYSSVDMWSLYRKSVTYLGDIVESAAGVRPSVVFGPNTELGRSDDEMASKDDKRFNPGPTNTDVYVDTKNFGMTVVRPQQRNSRWNNSFIAPKNDAEWEKLHDPYGKPQEGLLPMTQNTTEDDELWLKNPELWKKLNGKS